jgi:hypothetical protein
MPSPTIATTALPGLQRIDRRRLVRGQDAGAEIIDTSLLGNRRGGGEMVTGQHHDADSHALETSHGGTRGLAQRVGDGQQRQRDGSRIVSRHRWGDALLHVRTTTVLPARCRVSINSSGKARPTQPSGAASRSQRPATRPSTPRPGIARNSSSSGKTDAGGLCVLQDGPPQRMFRSLFQASSQRQRFLGRRRQRDKIGDERFAARQGAGLVDRQYADLLGTLERLGIPDQDAGCGALTAGDHDRRRRGQPEGAGTGDHQHRHGIDQRAC